MKKRLVTSFVTLVASPPPESPLGEPSRFQNRRRRRTASDVPITRVKRGRVTITVSARGELQGGNSEMLVAPMAGVDTMAITFLRERGELVKAGDIVVEFDTTQQEFNLTRSPSRSPRSRTAGHPGESRQPSHSRGSPVSVPIHAVRSQTRATRSSPQSAATGHRARQNDLAVDAAQNRLHQAEQDIINKKANADAGIAIQEAAQNKAKVAAPKPRNA